VTMATADELRAEIDALTAEIEASGHQDVKDLVDRRVALRARLRRAEHRFRSYGAAHILDVEPDGDGWVVRLSGWTQDIRVPLTTKQTLLLADAIGTRRSFTVVTGDAHVQLEPAAEGAWAVRVADDTSSRSARLSADEAAELATIITERNTVV